MRVIIKSILCGNVAGVHQVYQPGDVADVPDDEAQALIAGGYAEPAASQPAKPAKAAKAAKSDEPAPAEPAAAEAAAQPEAKEVKGGTSGRKPARRPAARS